MPEHKCTLICLHFLFESPKERKKRYFKNNKRCVLCAKYIKTLKLYCPCCGYKLRCNSRSKNIRSINEFRYS